jgi:hypothetical protein
MFPKIIISDGSFVSAIRQGTVKSHINIAVSHFVSIKVVPSSESFVTVVAFVSFVMFLFDSCTH